MRRPVDAGRGFVLHSDDYMSQSTMPVNDESVPDRHGRQSCAPSRTAAAPGAESLMLGYARWGPGQLENEIFANAWLSCPATDDIVFDPDHSGKYDRVLASMGIAPAMLSTEAGHA